jgi:phosphomevalonate kinase
MAGAWASGAGRHVLAEYRRYIRALREFSDDHGLGIFAAGHAEVSAAADEAGLVYKPCGAGGGDIGILLADDRQRANEFVATSLPASFEVLDIYCDPQGVEATGTLH